MTDSVDVERGATVSPVDAFSLLGNETRVAILRALGDANEGSAVQPLSFEELRRACDVADSGRFNYHLQKMLDVFVSKEGDEYDLLYPGVILYQAINANLFTERPSFDPVAFDADCGDCGGTLAVSYRNQMLLVRCCDCDDLKLKYYLPPAVAGGGDVDEILRGADQFARRDVMLVANDVCPTCGNAIDHEVVPEDEKSSALERDIDGLAVVHVCGYCNRFFTTSVPLLLVYHPAVVSFYYERGTDVLARPLWELGFDAEECVSVVERAPLELAVDFEARGDRLRVRLDDDLDVTSVTQEPSTP